MFVAAQSNVFELARKQWWESETFRVRYQQGSNAICTHGIPDQHNAPVPVH